MANSFNYQNKSIHVGDTVAVHYKIIEKEVISGKTKKEKHEEAKERTQAFEGIVISVKGAGANQSFCVRRMGAANVGIERIFPVLSPWIKKIVIKKKGDVRRAKLYYLRDKTAKEVSKLASKEMKEEVVNKVEKEKKVDKVEKVDEEK